MRSPVRARNITQACSIPQANETGICWSGCLFIQCVRSLSRRPLRSTKPQSAGHGRALFGLCSLLCLVRLAALLNSFWHTAQVGAVLSDTYQILDDSFHKRMNTHGAGDAIAVTVSYETGVSWLISELLSAIDGVVACPMNGDRIHRQKLGKDGPSGKIP